MRFLGTHEEEVVQALAIVGAYIVIRNGLSLVTSLRRSLSK
jgi:hypothetical protein